MKLIFNTDYPIAYESPDHINPWGTKRDLSRQLRFEKKLTYYMQFKIFNNILDLGCSGGAFISAMHDLGFQSIGIEGSDFSKKNNRGPWAFLSNFVLFTGDITKPFQIRISDEKKNVEFDIITAFEVLEHLKEDQIESLFSNIELHSSINTRLIFSISQSDDFINGVNLHQTVKKEEWWIAKFERLGWVKCNLSMLYFNKHYLRGKHFGAPSSFEVVLKKINSKDDNIPKLSFFSKLLDYYSGSKLQRIFYTIVHGHSSY